MPDYNFQFSIFNFQCRIEFSDINVRAKGFTLIELLIVITLFGLSASLITASYLTFERNNRTRDAALNLKNDLRLAQSNALSGKKIETNEQTQSQEQCTSIQPLVGWYIRITESSSGYLFENNCGAGVTKGSRTRVFADGVSVGTIEINGTEHLAGDQTYDILFKPLTNKAFFYEGVGAPVDFTGKIPLNNSPTNATYMTINLIGSSSTYTVTINAASGEVHDERL